MHRFRAAWVKRGGAGEFDSLSVAGVAVDNDPLSASYNDVYVVDDRNHRVEKFGPSGEFLLMFGGHVNATTGADVCVVGEECQEGEEGVADGEFSSKLSESHHQAIGPGGEVYVGDKAPASRSSNRPGRGRKAFHSPRFRVKAGSARSR